MHITTEGNTRQYGEADMEECNDKGDGMGGDAKLSAEEGCEDSGLGSKDLLCYLQNTMNRISCGFTTSIGSVD